jgi:hypothetical protein
MPPSDHETRTGNDPIPGLQAPRQEWLGLSIRQPWIDLILKGLKTIEVRNWNVKPIGPVLLHSSLTIDWQAIEMFGCSQPWSLPRGRLVGYAEITQSFEFTRESWRARADQHLVMRPLGEGQYGAVVEKVHSFPNPVVCPGKLYFFSIPNKILQKMQKQLLAVQGSLQKK